MSYIPTVNIKGYFLNDNNTINDDKPPKEIFLLVTDYHYIKKLKNTAVHIVRPGEDNPTPKIPLKNNLLKIAVSQTTMCYKTQEDPDSQKQVHIASSFKELLGSEVEAKLEIKKYAFASQFKKNRGEKITGIRCLLLQLKGL